MLDARPEVLDLCFVNFFSSCEGPFLRFIEQIIFHARYRSGERSHERLQDVRLWGEGNAGGRVVSGHKTSKIWILK